MARKPARKARTGKRKTARRGAVARPAARKRAARPKSKRASAPTRRPAASKAKSPKNKSPKKKTAVKVKGKARPASRKARPIRRAGGTGRESTLAQTPATGRTVQGRTNPMPTKRSTGTAAGAGDSRRVPGLERERRQLREVEESVPGPPSSLNMDRHGSAARSGRAAMRHAKKEHTEAGPSLTGGDVDADWEDAYAVGDEAPGGDNPTPDQDVVEEIGAALGVTYQDDEELKASEKIIERDRHRWELDPASAEDYNEHDKD
jgi:uncharacterized protein DUF6335